MWALNLERLTGHPIQKYSFCVFIRKCVAIHISSHRFNINLIRRRMQLLLHALIVSVLVLSVIYLIEFFHNTCFWWIFFVLQRYDSFLKGKVMIYVYRKIPSGMMGFLLMLLDLSMGLMSRLHPLFVLIRTVLEIPLSLPTTILLRVLLWAIYLSCTSSSL